MANQNYTYIVRTPDGEEFPPAEPETLIEWVRKKHITRNCQMRPRLINRWSPVTDYDFLRQALDENQPEDNPRKSRRKQPQQTEHFPYATDLGIRKTVPPYSPAGVHLRILAGLFDVIILTILAVLVQVLVSAPAPVGQIPYADNLFPVGVFFAATLLYYTWCVGFRAQTLGQQFWGVMVIRKDTRPVYAARAAMFSILTLLLGIPGIILVLLCFMRHTPAEKFTNTRVAFIRIKYQMPS